MSELGGLESYSPDEGTGGGSEVLSEEAKERFRASAAAAQKGRKQEKKSKKRDDQVAVAIKQFMGIKKFSHFVVLITRLSARDCPSIFILAILSLIHKECFDQVQGYLMETTGKTAHENVQEGLALLQKEDAIDQEANVSLIDWIARMQMVLSTDPDKILMKLMIDETNIDGTVLQLSTFTLQEFFKMKGKNPDFDQMQPLTASILQAVFEPYIESAKKKMLEEQAQEEDDDDE